MLHAGPLKCLFYWGIYKCKKRPYRITPINNQRWLRGDSRSQCCSILQLSVWITGRTSDDSSQMPRSLQRSTVFSFITLQTRTAAWSCLHFALGDTSSLSCVPPPNPLLSLAPIPRRRHRPRHLLPHLHLGLVCTQTQRDASCNHRWTQFQGQFEDHLLSLVNKKRMKNRVDKIFGKV